MPPSVSGPPENCKRFHARADRAGGETRRCGRARQAGNAEIIRRSRGYLLSRGALVFGCGPVVVVGQQHELSKQLATARSSAEKSSFFIGLSASVATSSGKCKPLIQWSLRVSKLATLPARLLIIRYLVGRWCPAYLAGHSYPAGRWGQVLPCDPRPLASCLRPPGRYCPIRFVALS